MAFVSKPAGLERLTSTWTEKQQALLQGCIDSDGYIDHSKKEISITTISRLLAFGIARLCRNINGYQVSICKKPPAKNSMINGRKIISRHPIYSLSWKSNLTIMRTTVPDDNCVWSSFRCISPGDLSTVYNLSVEESESYVVNGIAVHNCSPHRCHCHFLKRLAEAIVDPEPIFEEKSDLKEFGF